MSNSAPAISGKEISSGAFDLFRTDPFVLAMFFSLLLLGGDRIAISAGGMTLRVVFPLLILSFFFFFRQRDGDVEFERSYTFLFMAFATVGALSTINSLAPVKSIGYTIWILFDFFIVITLCYNFALRYPPEAVLSVWLWTFRIHGILIFFDLPFALKSGDRTTLWFYETSYLAIFMTGYFGSSLFLLLRRGRRYGWDVALSALAMGALASATALVSIIFCIFLNIILARQRFKLLATSLLLLAFFLIVLSQFFADTLYYRLMAGFILQPELSILPLLDRGGNRYIRILVGLDAFRHSPWLGIGIGGDDAYMNQHALPPDAWQMAQVHKDVDQGQPFCNIFVQVLGSMGILGLILFAAINLRAGWQMIRSTMGKDTNIAAAALFVGFFSTVLALQMDGTFLRYYLWSPLGLALGILSQQQQNRAES